VIHPATRELLQSAAKQADFQTLLQRLTRGEPGPHSISGLVNTAKALYLVLLYQAIEKPLFVLVDGNKQAEALHESIDVFFHLLFEGRDLPKPLLIPALDVLPHQKLSPHNEIAEERAVGLWRLSAQRVPIAIAPIASALLRTESADFYRQLALTLRVGEELPLEDVAQHIESIGYERREPVEMVGEYSVRGGIFDVFPAEASRPVRVEFFGDLIEEIRQFDVESQRSVLKISSATLLPLAEYPRSRRLLRELADKALGISHAPRAAARGEPVFAQSRCAGDFRRARGDRFGRGPAMATAGASGAAGANRAGEELPALGRVEERARTKNADQRTRTGGHRPSSS
jgi:transcription-repair coupling factor (superfamily II helicase)